MNKLATIIFLFSFSVSGCYSVSQTQRPEDYNSNYNSEGLTYQTFYDDLQPYGNWIDYPGYGYVWQPNTGSGFTPYQTGGHWVSTVDGWAWASDYNWGWAPFHYGRWLNEPAIGWAWVPGLQWAPAWVTWGQYGDYYAWAPLAPGINISIGSSWRAPANYWSYVPRNCINYSNLNRYVNRGNFNRTTVVNNITIINNYNSYNRTDYYHRGPDYRQVEQYTHKQINPVAIAATSRPGVERVNNNRQFQVYRPVVSTNTQANSAPARVVRMNEIKDRRNNTSDRSVIDNSVISNRSGNINAPSVGSPAQQNSNAATANPPAIREYRNDRFSGTKNNYPDAQTQQQPANQPVNSSPANVAPPVIRDRRFQRNDRPSDNLQQTQTQTQTQAPVQQGQKLRSFSQPSPAPVQRQQPVFNSNNNVQRIEQRPVQQNVQQMRPPQPQPQPSFQKPAENRVQIQRPARIKS